MSKIIYVCFRFPEEGLSINEDLKTIAKRLVPDNIISKPPKIVSNRGIIYGIVNPVNSVEEHLGSVLLGKIFGDADKWWEPGQESPDGSYALFRGGEKKVEIVSDVVGSRSIWYYKDDDKFIASTSQRAIIGLLRNFSFNEEVLPWVMSTGGLGPSQSWDSRLQLLPADSAAELDRQTWSLTVKTVSVKFEPLDVPDEKHEELLRGALEGTFKSLNLNYDDWVLPLSGGYDSRSILGFLHKSGRGVENLKAITWGLKESVDKKDNDAYIAALVAGHFKIKHEFYPTDLTDEPVEDFFNRFLICGEGRIDHIGGYLDGFKIWKTLYEDKVQGIIRGDIGFSSIVPDSQYTIRKRMALALCSDWANLQDYESYGFKKQELPENLKRKKDETLVRWRDRLYHEYRIPIVLAALSDLKLSYCEIINPLLSRKIVYQIRQLPDHLRSGKRLFKTIVNSLSDEIPYATSAANADRTNTLKSEEIVNLLRKELCTDKVKSIYPEKFLAYVLSNLKIGDNSKRKKKSLFSLLKSYAPRWMRTKPISDKMKPPVDFNLLAFRIYISAKMHDLLSKDANCLNFSTAASGLKY